MAVLMMSAFDMESLCRLLDRHQKIVAANPGVRAIPAATAFLRFVRSEPRLASLTNELLVESQKARQTNNQHCEALLRSLQEVHAAHQLALTVRATDLTFNNEASYREILDDLRQPSNPRLARVAFRQLGSMLEELTDALRDLAPADEDDRALLKASAGELRRLAVLHRQLGLKLAADAETFPGEAYLALIDYVDQLVPAIHKDARGRATVFTPHLERAEDIRKKIEHTKALGPSEEDLAESEIDHLVQRVVVALQAALTQGVSQAALIRRFASRCESFRAVQLRERIEQAPGKVEAELRLEFAEYLFDAGLNPIIDADVAGLKPDVIHSTGVPALYVEVKQREQVTLSALRGAVAQVLDTWQRLANRFDVPEAVLLVYRLGGRPVHLQGELLAPLGRLLIQVVNLAPTTESGSKAAMPLIIALQDLLDAPGG